MLSEMTAPSDVERDDRTCTELCAAGVTMVGLRLTGALLTVQLNVAVANKPPGSVTLTVGLKDPATVVVPEMTPLPAAIDRPLGRPSGRVGETVAVWIGCRNREVHCGTECRDLSSRGDDRRWTVGDATTRLDLERQADELFRADIAVVNVRPGYCLRCAVAAHLAFQDPETPGKG